MTAPEVLGVLIALYLSGVCFLSAIRKYESGGRTADRDARADRGAARVIPFRGGAATNGIPHSDRQGE